MKSQGDESRVEKYIRFFEEQDASDAYQIIEKLKKKRKFIDSVLVTEVEEFGSNVFRAAFIGLLFLIRLLKKNLLLQICY